MSGLNANDTATYSCQLGHKLVGSKVITCRLGGIWSSSPPTCQFVDCGPAPEPEHGSVWLVNGTTTFASQATYTCESDYRLQGRTTRLCQEDGSWSSSLPTCKRKILFSTVVELWLNVSFLIGCSRLNSYRMRGTGYSSWKLCNRHWFHNSQRDSLLLWKRSLDEWRIEEKMSPIRFLVRFSSVVYL